MAAWPRGQGPSGGSTDQAASPPTCPPLPPRCEVVPGGPLASASVLNDLCPKSEVKEGLGEGVCDGRDSQAEVRGPHYVPRCPAWSWIEELSSSSLWPRKERVIR